MENSEEKEAATTDTKVSAGEKQFDDD